jgi:phage-related protein
MIDLRPIKFRGDSLEALRKFPETGRRRAGQQLYIALFSEEDPQKEHSQ